MTDAALILVAAGKSVRLGSDLPKPYLPLAGEPMLVQSLRTLCGLDSLRRAVVVAAADRLADAAGIIAERGPWRAPVEIVAGGAERQDSVANGLAAVTEPYVMIHDAARPFISLDTAAACLQAAIRSGAAIVAVPAHDTVKLAGVDGSIERTVDRSRIWLAQTPQTFRTELLRQALARARARGEILTDDAALMEAAGHPVELVPGDPDNRKITTAADYHWAQWFARAREVQSPSFPRRGQGGG
ncbi:MAG TPA: 2-C-methyl-D-erythritol 4-phosphate cytidylyltransferase [Terriglobales bacterium]|nr:2-C-methyl-D-erythritol 4-phosphate cytidylyltransferase [Terriglobales bacterium]